MNQNSMDERNQLLLVMAGEDLKQILGSVSVLLAGYLQEVGKYVTASEAQHFAVRVGDLQCASTEMVVFIDEMLAILDQGSVAVVPLKLLIQNVYGNNPSDLNHYAASNEKPELRLHDAPSWLM